MIPLRPRDPRRNHPAYEISSPLPPPPKVPSTSVLARAAHTPLARLLVMIAAATTGIAGVFTALGAAVVQVVDSVAEANARRSNVELDRRIEAIEVRVNGRFGLDLEEKARQRKDDEVDEELGRVRSRIRKLEAKD